MGNVVGQSFRALINRYHQKIHLRESSLVGGLDMPLQLIGFQRRRDFALDKQRPDFIVVYPGIREAAAFKLFFRELILSGKTLLNDPEFCWRRPCCYPFDELPEKARLLVQCTCQRMG